MNRFEFAVPMLFGLEGIAGDELRRLDIENVRVENGRVLFSGDETALARANMNLRTGERVLIVLAEFEARSFEELFQGVYRCPLEQFIPADGQFPVKGHSLNSQLASVPDCQAIIKKAASRRLGEKYGISWLPETGAKYQLQFSIMADKVTLYLDTSGAGLHKRGYRRESLGAPIRETLAAAIAATARPRENVLLWDPMCGSGTIAIEAAMLMRNIAPGRSREFIAEEFPFIDKSIWKSAREEAFDVERKSDFEAFASDIDPSAVALAEKNARLAGVADTVKVFRRDARKISADGRRGTIVCTPPYGERLGTMREVEQPYRDIGVHFRSLSPWQVYVITSHPGFEKFYGKRADKVRKLYNGMIPCYLYQFFKNK